MLSGTSNDKDTLVSAVRLAARNRAKLRIVLAKGAIREECEKHLDFALWDVRQRLGVNAPEVTIESRLPEFELALEEIPLAGLSTERPISGVRR